MKRFQNVSLVDLPLSTYDIIVVLRNMEGQEEIIRAQVKTAKSSVSFVGGSRGGIDREYKSGIKTYVQSTLTSDVIIGITPHENESYDLYFIPTILVEHLGQKSIAISKIEDLKNNYNVLKNCKNHKFILSKCREFGIIK
jgi:hypothetical protein